MRTVMQPVSGTFELRRQRHSSEETPPAGRRPKRQISAGFEAVAMAVAPVRSGEAQAVERGQREVVPLPR